MVEKQAHKDGLLQDQLPRRLAQAQAAEQRQRKREPEVYRRTQGVVSAFPALCVLLAWAIKRVCGKGRLHVKAWRSAQQQQQLGDHIQEYGNYPL